MMTMQQQQNKADPRQGPSKQRRATNNEMSQPKKQQQKCALGGFSVLPLLHWHYDDLSIVSHGQQQKVL